MGVPKVTLIRAKEIKVKLFLCTSLRSGGTGPHILTATFRRESPPLLTEQEAGGAHSQSAGLEKRKK